MTVSIPCDCCGGSPPPPPPPCEDGCTDGPNSFQVVVSGVLNGTCINCAEINGTWCLDNNEIECEYSTFAFPLPSDDVTFTCQSDTTDPLGTTFIMDYGLGLNTPGLWGWQLSIITYGSPGGCWDVWVYQYDSA